jgi:hypothetical protein
MVEVNSFHGCSAWRNQETKAKSSLLDYQCNEIEWGEERSGVQLPSLTDKHNSPSMEVVSAGSYAKILYISLLYFLPDAQYCTVEIEY